MSGYASGILALLCINIVFAYGVFLPVSTGQLNLGGAGFQALGAYMAAFLAAHYDMPVAVTLPLSAAIGAVSGLIVALPVLQMRGAYMVLATIAFTQLVGGVILASSTLGDASGIPVPTYVGLDIILPITLATIVIVFYLMGTRLGLAMRSVHDDDLIADLMGVNVRAAQIFSFALGGMFAGLSGGLYAHQFGFVQAQSFDDMASVDVLLFVLLGGTQTAWGPLVGTICFTLIPEFLRNLLPQAVTLVASLFHGLGWHGARPDDSWRFVILGIFTVAMMMIRPEGIVTRVMVDRIASLGRRRPRIEARS